MMRFFHGAAVAAALCLLTAQAQLTWPPQFAIGQVWNVEIDSLGSWTFELDRQQRSSGMDAFAGNNVNPNQSQGVVMAYEQISDAVLALVVDQRNEAQSYACLATRAGNPRNSLIYAVALRITSVNPFRTQALGLECRLRWTNAATNPTSSSPSVPVAPGLVKPLGQVPILAWPPVFTVGTRLSLGIPGQQPWALTVSAVDKDGKTFRGEASAASGTWQAVLFYRANDDALQTDFTLGAQMYSCIFVGKQSLRGTSLIGNTYYRANATANFQEVKGSCELRSAP